MAFLTKDTTEINKKSLKSSPPSTRYRFGVKRVSHRGQSILTTVGSERFEQLLGKVPKRIVFRTGKVPLEYEHRPDLISSLFYNTPGYWWYLMMVNNVTDPFEGFKAGDTIFIPELIF